MNEGEEPDEFWAALGGKGPYTTDNPMAPLLKPHLFHCIVYTGSGRMPVEEIKSFKQEYLVDDDLMIIDSGLEISVWMGNLCVGSQQGRSEGLRIVQMRYFHN